ncbi:MAG: hypothetical protein WCK27_02295 [Verrucomicrobiota bacterium]
MKTLFALARRANVASTTWTLTSAMLVVSNTSPLSNLAITTAP